MSDKKPIFETEVFPAFRDYLQPARFKVAYGGRGSGKTRSFCSPLLNNVLWYAWRVVCFREIMEAIKDSVYTEFVDEIERRNLGEFFNIKADRIECKINSGVIKFSGIKSSSNRLNSQKLKGFSGFDAAWLEEANAVSKESWQFLIPTMRKEGSEIWVSFNPFSILEPTYQMFVSDCHIPEFKDGKRYSVIKKINWQDNPRFPDELRADMEIMRERDYEEYLHVYEGMPVSSSENAIIKSKWVHAAIDAHKKLGIMPSGIRRGAYDVADGGEDLNAFCIRHGQLVERVEKWSGKGSDLGYSVDRAFNLCADADLKEFLYDADGVGAGVMGIARVKNEERKRNRLLPIKVTIFRGSAEVVKPQSEMFAGRKNIDYFANYKAQAWFNLRRLFENTYNAVVNNVDTKTDDMIFLDGTMENLNELVAELSQPTYDMTASGKMLVEKKPNNARSPNLADSVMMCYAPVTNFFL